MSRKSRKTKNTIDKQPFSATISLVSNYTKPRPSCEHGPTLLFEKLATAEQRFFACAAFRDRKGCSYFMKLDEWQKKLSRSSNGDQSTTNVYHNQVQERPIRSPTERFVELQSFILL